MKQLRIFLELFLLSGCLSLLHAQQKDSSVVIPGLAIPPDTSLNPGPLAPLASQPGNNFEVPQVVSPSPDAASLGKYGSIPVGLYTGIPDINIPLYTIKTNKLEVPISISYLACGFKVNEIASWIGLGWTLNTGGVITRSVVGRPDEGGFWNKSVKRANQITSTDYDYLKLIADGGDDGESDYYFYNFNGHSGKFFYYQNNSTSPLLIPEAPIKIIYSSGYYTVTDERGIVYKFATIEYMNFTDANHTLSSFKSSFYLSEIISADGLDHIYFTYDIDNTYINVV